MEKYTNCLVSGVHSLAPPAMMAPPKRYRLDWIIRSKNNHTKSGEGERRADKELATDDERAARTTGCIGGDIGDGWDSSGSGLSDAGEGRRAGRGIVADVRDRVRCRGTELLRLRGDCGGDAFTGERIPTGVASGVGTGVEVVEARGGVSAGTGLRVGSGLDLSFSPSIFTRSDGRTVVSNETSCCCCCLNGDNDRCAVGERTGDSLRCCVLVGEVGCTVGAIGTAVG